MNNFIKDKFIENYNFNGYRIDIEEKSIYFKIKHINYLQSQFIYSNLNSFISDDDKLKELIYFLVDIKKEDLELIIINQQALEQFFDIIFKENNINITFFNTLKTKLKLISLNKDSVFNFFIRFLLDNSISILDIKKLTDFQIIEYSIELAFIKHNDDFFNILNKICEKSEDNELIELINSFISVKKQKAPSAFDMLSEL